MPDIPPEAVRLALAARAHALADRPDSMVLSDETLTRLMLEAAAPALAEHVAGRLRAHADRRWPLEGPTAPASEAARIRRRAFISAAQVAALAFSTDDDLRRAAAEVLERAYRKAIAKEEA